MNQEETSQCTGPSPLGLKFVPSGNFQLNVFLAKISDKLTADDLKKLKFFCAGENGFGKAVLEKINDGLDLFRHLQQLQLLSDENLVTLQAMLWHVQRKDLCSDFVEYCKDQDKAIHFVAASDQPANGYKFVHFHIRGTQRYTLDDLRILRNELSYLLCCPSNHVIINGIEPTNSLHITIMVPEDHVEFLYNIGNQERMILFKLGVDCYKIDDMQIYCTEFDNEAEIPSLGKDEEVRRILRVNEQLQRDVKKYQLSYEECYANAKENLKFFLENQRELKYAKELSDEDVMLLRNKIKEYQVMCRQLSQDLETIIPLTPKQLRDALLSQSIEELQKLSSDYQSQLIVLLKSSSASKTTSLIMKHFNDNTDEKMKVLIRGEVNTDNFDDVYRVALNLKTVENILSNRQPSKPRLNSVSSFSDDEDEEEYGAF